MTVDQLHAELRKVSERLAQAVGRIEKLEKQRADDEAEANAALAKFDASMAEMPAFKAKCQRDAEELTRLRTVLQELASGLSGAWAGDAGPAMEVEHLRAKARAALGEEKEGR